MLAHQSRRSLGPCELAWGSVMECMAEPRLPSNGVAKLGGRPQSLGPRSEELG
jgi:hypothetical protein